MRGHVLAASGARQVRWQPPAAERPGQLPMIMFTQWHEPASRLNEPPHWSALRAVRNCTLKVASEPGSAVENFATPAAARHL